MPNLPVTVRLDPRRLEQLKAIAHAEGSTVTEVITQIIRSKIADGVIDRSIPGVSVNTGPEGVEVDLGAGKQATFGQGSAIALANTIKGVVAGGSSVVSLDHGFAVIRQGSGIKIAAPFPGPEVAFPASLAEDLAGVIEMAVK